MTTRTLTDIDRVMHPVKSTHILTDGKEKYIFYGDKKTFQKIASKKVLE